MTTRRGFLKAILAAGFAPAVVGSGILMPVRSLWTPDRKFWTGLRDLDCEALVRGDLAKAIARDLDALLIGGPGRWLCVHHSTKTISQSRTPLRPGFWTSAIITTPHHTMTRAAYHRVHGTQIFVSEADDA